jgi:hypothetical protein
MRLPAPTDCPYNTHRALGAVENQQGSQILLRWHAALTDKVGMGLISRALSESDTV